MQEIKIPKEALIPKIVEALEEEIKGLEDFTGEVKIENVKWTNYGICVRINLKD